MVGVTAKGDLGSGLAGYLGEQVRGQGFFEMRKDECGMRKLVRSSAEVIRQRQIRFRVVSSAIEVKLQ